MNFVTLNTITNDLLNIIRGASPADTEPISETQIHGWIHQYRAMFLKRDLDKNKLPNPDYIQEIPVLLLSPEDKLGDGSTIKSGEIIYSTIAIPNAIDLGNRSGLLYVGDPLGNQIQLVAESRIPWINHSDYSKLLPIAYLKNNKIYIKNHNGLKYIAIRGVFENPTEVYNITSSTLNQREANLDTAYPFPMDKLPALKEAILKMELGIVVKSPDDEINDSDHKVQLGQSR